MTARNWFKQRWLKMLAPRQVDVTEGPTDLQEAIEALRQAEERSRAGFYGSPVPLHTLSPGGVIIDVSDRWIEMLGYQRGEVLGQQCKRFHDPTFSEAASDDYANLKAGIEVRDEPRTLIRRDGTLMPALISKRLECLPSGQEFVIAAVVDVSAQRTVEAALRTGEERLRHAQKMEAIGQLTGGVAHDFNNVLQAVGGSVQLVRSRIKRDGIEADQGQMLRLLDNALDACGKAARLTQQLLSFARRSRLDPTSLDPVEVVRALEPLMKSAAGERIEIQWDVARGVGRCFADRNQLESGLLNLVTNARDAIGRTNGTITISVRTVSLKDAPDDEDRPPAGHYVRIAVRDDGSGMTDETKRHAFEPFFTTKDVGKGTGLGLAQLYGFARQSGGVATIDSRLGEGSEVAILLPRIAPPVEAVMAPDVGEPMAVPRGNGELLLVVEDDPTVRLVLTGTLSDLGYRVVEAGNADDALVAMASEALLAKAVLTDMAMPGTLDGLELAVRIKAATPELPVFLMTGNMDPPKRERLPPGVVFLAKPYRREDVATALHAALARAD